MEQKERILVKITSFEGQVVANGEYINRCKEGDIIEVKQSTWEILKATFPSWFELIKQTRYKRGKE